MTREAVSGMGEPAIAVGCIYDASGMRTWCIEAAESLAETGRRVCLLHSTAVPPPTVSASVDTVPIERSHVMPRREGGRIRRELARISRRPGPCLREAIRQLDARGLSPEAFFLNASLFVDPVIEVPQFVVAWASPASFVGYMKKLPTHHRRLWSIDGIRTMLDHVGFYRRDWFAYRHATGVLSVTKHLHSELRASGVKSTLVYPGNRIDPLPTRQPSDVKRLVMMAADLDAPRKRVHWMLTALRGFPVRAELILIGPGSTATIELAKSTGMRVEATGPLTREDAIAAMRSGDVFLFGSILDDWGYVLVEALSCGLTVVAPDLSPYDESVGPAGFLYAADSALSFREMTMAACAGEAMPIQARQKWLERFSRPAFAGALLRLAASCRPAR